MNKNTNKVVLGNRVLIDLTKDTVTTKDVAEGVQFHAPDGSVQFGTGSTGSGYGISVIFNDVYYGFDTVCFIINGIEHQITDVNWGQIIALPPLNNVETIAIRADHFGYYYDAPFCSWFRIRPVGEYEWYDLSEEEEYALESDCELMFALAVVI